MRRLAILSATVLVALFSSVLLGSAATSRTVTIDGTARLVINNNVAVDFRFTPGPLVVNSGGSVTWTNVTNDGHSISVAAKKSDLPSTVGQVFGCGMPGTVCATYFARHFPNGPFAPPVQFLGNTSAVNGQLRGFGDSFLIGCGTPGPSCEIPVELGTTYTMKITAPAGSTLHYLCIFHAWMQGEIDVT